MKYLITIFLTVVVATLAPAQGIEAYLSHCEFDIPGRGPFTEISLALTGRSLQWKESAASVEITLLLRKNDTIVTFSKEILNKTEDDTATQKAINLIYQKRLFAPAGRYRLTVKLIDLHRNKDSLITTTFPLSLALQSDSTYCSGILNVKKARKTRQSSEFTHSGLELTPHLSDFYDANDTLLNFYMEIYPKGNLNPGDDYLLVYFLRSFENQIVVNNTRHYKRMKAATVNPYYGSIDIKDLPTGNYELTVLIKNRKNRLLTARALFFRKKNLLDAALQQQIEELETASSFVSGLRNYDTLSYVLKSMGPISSENQKAFVQSLIRGGNVEYMQKYLLWFWEKRSPANPVESFNRYMKQVDIVEKEFSTRIRHGYETDRGRVYLQYGPPNTRMKNYTEPSAYPYEIWHYYNLGTQRNRKFVFYNTDLVTNEFYLLHSDAIGEPSDYQWRLKLRSRDAGFRSIDQTGEHENDWGSEYNRWYNEPR